MATRKLCFGLLMAIMIVSLSLLPQQCEARPRRSAMANSQNINFNIRVWLKLMREKINQLKEAVGEKRGCNSFPCMYTHLSSKAGKKALMKTLFGKLSDCANDPNCSPGKRRRRSASTQERAILTQQQATS